MSSKPFHFKQFDIYQDQCAMKIGTDGVLLGAWCNCKNANSVLDIGTGTGVIAIMIAQRNETANIVAIEIDEAASKQATSNASNSKWSERIKVVHQSLQEFTIRNSSKFDLITCNPPYYKNSDFTSAIGLSRSVARNDSELNFDDLIKNASQLLQPYGKIALVIPFTELKRLEVIIKSWNLFIQKITYVQPKIEKAISRVLLEISFEADNYIEDTLVIQKEKRNDFTNEYIALTRAFYTIM